MLGFLLSEKEGKELDYILIKQAIRSRFRIVYNMYSRYGNRKEKANYIDELRKVKNW